MPSGPQHGLAVMGNSFANIDKLKPAVVPAGVNAGADQAGARNSPLSSAATAMASFLEAREDRESIFVPLRFQIVVFFANWSQQNLGL